MPVMSTCSTANTSREIPEVKDRERTVQSYELVYTFHEWEVSKKKRASWYVTHIMRIDGVELDARNA